MDKPSDAELHVLILAGDDDALRIWQERTGPAVFAMLRRAGASPDEAEEIWADALFATWRRAGQEPPLGPLGEALRRYAFGVARRQLAHRREQSKRKVATVALDERDREPVADGGGQARPSPIVHALRRCLEMVDERVRVVIDLVMIQSTPDEIASNLGIAKASVGKTVQRAKAVLRDCIEAETHV